MNQPVKSYTNANQFRFVCPIFSAEVGIRECFILRDAWMKGTKVAVRKGCQACMSASKCPVGHIVSSIQHGGPDAYYSPVPKVGSLRPEILDRIGPIVVTERCIERFPELDDKQKAAIRAVNGVLGVAAFKTKRAAAVLEHIDEDTCVQVYRSRDDRAGEEPVAPKPSKKDTALLDAAASGDISAAINNAIAEAA